MEASSSKSDIQQIAYLWGSWFAIITLWILAAFHVLSGASPVWLGIVILPVVLVAGYLKPHLATYACVFLIYSNLPVVAAQFHGLPYAIVAMTPAMLLLPLGYFLWVRGEGIIFPWEGMFVVGMVVVQSFGVMFSRAPDESFSDLVRSIFEGLGLFFLVINAIRTPEILRGSLWAILATGAFMGAVTGHQYLTNNYQSDYGGLAQADQLGFSEVNERGVSIVRARSAGPIGEKNRYAQNMLMLLPIGVCLALTQRNQWLKALAWGATGLTIFGWAVTFSRGSVVGLAGAIVIAVFLGYLRPRVLVVMGITAVLFVAVMPAYRERITSLLAASQLVTSTQGSQEIDGSLRSRATIMMAAANVIAENPILGVGQGMFPYYAREYGKKSGYSVVHGNWEAHNLYLGIGADSGLLGLSCFLAAIGVVIVRLHRIRRQFLQTNPAVALTATALVFTLLIYLMSGMFLHYSYIRYFWLMFAMASATATIFARTTTSQPTNQASQNYSDPIHKLTNQNG
ncbi:O-Antigen ligase [Bremerella volcania]|uniref:O-Antigen ligase n=1 Tax=Bremerella volcania TaxID=2527984 RepID=A0A518C977_9BACT|nr:O-antigen ligase family protein [Bremerella volcania]QDU75744.1 O-Antigen ligase [Bremerella volcania]